MALLGAACSLCIASTCPTPDPFPSTPINAPSFTSLELIGEKWSDEYQPTIHLQWTLAGKDSLPVGKFIVLRKREMFDTTFEILPTDIPDSQYEDWDKLEATDFPDQGVYKKIWYRVFAIDTAGRPGDTSTADSVKLSWPPHITEPVDTLLNNKFKWSTVRYLGGYYATLYLWNDSGLVWNSPRPEEPQYGHETPDSETLVLPSPPASLLPGAYYCGVKIQIPGEDIQSLALRQFYVP
jgi:hypothetical protein